MRQFEKLADDYTLLIDLDGTLIDTDYANFISYQESIYEITNIHINDLKNERFTREILRKYIPRLTLIEINKIIDLKNNLFSKNLHLTNLNISLVNLIKKYAKKNKIVLATNSHKERAQSLLEYFNIIDLFDFIFFKEDFEEINESKVQYVLNYFGISPKKLIIFENEEFIINDALSLGVPENNINYFNKGFYNV